MSEALEYYIRLYHVDLERVSDGKVSAPGPILAWPARLINEASTGMRFIDILITPAEEDCVHWLNPPCQSHEHYATSFEFVIIGGG